MSQILVRNLAPEVVERLKERAQRNHRSLEAEVRAILEGLTDSEQRRADALRFADWARAQNGPQSSASTELIREDRER